VKAWADGVLPPDAGTRGRRRRSLDAALAAASAAEEVAEDAIVGAPTPVPAKVPAGLREAAASARAPQAGPETVGDEEIVGEATGPMASQRLMEPTPEISFPRPAPPPAVAWRLVGASAGVALAAGFALGWVLGR
jgi:hypothetical protein